QMNRTRLAQRKCIRRGARCCSILSCCRRIRISASSRCRGLRQSHSKRTKRLAIAIIRRSCSDSLLTPSRGNGAFGSDKYWSNVSANRIRYAESAVADPERIVLHPGTRGWEAIRAFGEVSRTTFPGICKLHGEEVFKHFEAMLELLPEAERA